MKKQDLETRMIVEVAGGELFMVAGNELVSDLGFVNLDEYNDDLLSKRDTNYNIVKVYEKVESLSIIRGFTLFQNVLWTRK